MIDAKERLNKLKQQRKDKLEGKLQLIPFYHHFPKLSYFVPGIFKGAMITCMAGTGDSKSKFSKFCTILIPYWLQQKENLKYKIIYFALEESEEEFIDSIFLMLLKTRYDISIDYASLNSYREEAIDQKTLDLMDKCADEVNKILEHVTIIDNLFNPTGLYYACMDKAKQWGKINDDGTYTPTDPNLQVVVVCDHISLITGEKDKDSGTYLSKGQAMAKWSTHYCLKYITKRLNWSVWNVQQTTMTSEGSEKKKMNSLEPTAEDAANNKEILRDCSLILTLFSPYKNKIADYRGFDIKKLEDRFRNLGIIKNRYGPSNTNIPLYFDGAAGLYEEISRTDQNKYFKK
jgi:hypothetical protein